MKYRDMKVYLLAGTQRFSRPLRMRQLADEVGVSEGDGADGLVLFVSWPNSWTHFDLDITCEQERFSREISGPCGLVEMLGSCGVAESQISAASEAIEQFEFCIGEVSMDGSPSLTIQIDSDDEAFRAAYAEQGNPLNLLDSDDEAFRAAYAEQGNPLNLPLDVRLFIKRADGISPEGEELGIPCSISLLVDIEEMKFYPGDCALDFGNTSSAIACLHQDRKEANEVDVVPADFWLAEPDCHAGSDNTVPSAVRVFYCQEAESSNVRPEADWCAGTDALNGRDGGLILGAKRLIADPNQKEPFNVPVDGEYPLMLPKKLPGELFIASMFKGFFNRRSKFCAPLTITYPVTYSAQEIDALRRVVADAWGRGWLVPGYSHSVEDIQRLIPLMIDEASAAAFFFLYRDFLRRPGRTGVFHYLYPTGVNLLLYDCGGGTIDIALVHARASRHEHKTSDGDGTEISHESWEMGIDVLGRTGHRGFGGDDITAAVFRVLKAELACELSDQLKFPSDPQAMEAFVDDHRVAINETVPTAWRPMVSDFPEQGTESLETRDPTEYQARRNATEEFWNWCEAAKIFLADVENNPKAEPPHYPGYSRLWELVKTHNSNLAEETFTEALERVARNLKDRRAHVDALIMDDLQQTIDATNKMIANRLTEVTRTRVGERADRRKALDEDHDRINNVVLPADSPVHWVYAIGKASRYPLVGELLKKLLRVRNVAREDDEAGNDENIQPPPPRPRLRFDPDNAKTAVVRGAVLATRMQGQGVDVRIKWDTDLADRLPFTIRHDEWGHGGKKLFHEHEYYKDLKKDFIPVAPRDGILPTKVTLERLWPGGEWEPYLDFQFSAPPKGPLMVSCTTDSDGKRYFVMRDDITDQEVEGVERTELKFMSPIHRGNL